MQGKWFAVSPFIGILRILLALAFCCTITVGVSRADEYGCKVLLCLSNPAGPMAEEECRPPVERMLREQRQRHPPAIPSCEEANGAAYVRFGSSHYDSCPDGLSALPEDEQAVRGRIAHGGLIQAVEVSATVFTGIGEGDVGSVATALRRKKVCVGRHLGKVSIASGSGDVSSSFEVNAYEFVAVLDPFESTTNYADVIVHGKRYRRVRF